jgi:N-acetylglucosamine kinase-like BadF-type ATPase
MELAYVLGVDGGNTKTVALVVDRTGAVIGTGRAGCGDIYGVKAPELALAAIDRAVGAALASAGIEPHDLSAATFSLAGADWPADFELLETALRARGYSQRLTVVNDAMGALRAGSPDGTGVIVACGTATAIGARAATGQYWHSSWWQEPGGSEDLSRKAVRAVLRAELGIDPPTALKERMLAHSGMPSVEELLRRATGLQIPADLAINQNSFGRLLLDVAADGDPTAGRIVAEHGASLGDYALVAARKAGLIGQDFLLILAGGVFRHHSPLLREAMLERVRQVAPDIRPIQSSYEPVVGAVLLAVESLGGIIHPTLLDRLNATLPPHTFFLT